MADMSSRKHRENRGLDFGRGIWTRDSGKVCRGQSTLAVIVKSRGGCRGKNHILRISLSDFDPPDQSSI